MKEQNIVEWDDRLSVGIPVIDTQHKELIRLTNDLFRACLTSSSEAAAVFKTTLHNTTNYVRYHFTSEENLLERAKYPFLNGHKKEHETFVRQILEGSADYAAGRAFVPNKFVRFLRDWILSHIAQVDKEYALYLAGIGVKLETLS